VGRVCKSLEIAGHHCHHRLGKALIVDIRLHDDSGAPLFCWLVSERKVQDDDIRASIHAHP